MKILFVIAALLVAVSVVGEEPKHPELKQRTEGTLRVKGFATINGPFFHLEYKDKKTLDLDADGDLFDKLKELKDKQVRVTGKISKDRWTGQRVFVVDKIEAGLWKSDLIIK